MSTSSYKYLVIGAGNAAGYAADQFVKLGQTSDQICFIGEEPVTPYERPALSKAVLIKQNVRLPAFHTCVGSGGERHISHWYKENGIEIKLGKKVIDLDIQEKKVILDDGQQVIATHSIILATGASPIMLTTTEGHHLNGIHYLRDNQQGVALYEALQKNIGNNVIVVGGGYIGMEVSAAALTVGCKVTMVFPEDHIMPRLFTPAIAQHYENVFKQKGAVLINKGRLCKAFLSDGSGNVRGIICCAKGKEDIQIEGSLVVVGVGATPNTQLYKGKLDMDERGGVLVDYSMKTSADGIYAVGDIATFPLLMYDDKKVRMEHVQNARDSARHAVNAIVTSSQDKYDYLPYFYSRIFDLSWKFYGDSSGECCVVGDFNPKLLAIWVVDNFVQGVFMEHADDEQVGKMQKLARERPQVDVDAFNKCTTTDEAWALLA